MRKIKNGNKMKGPGKEQEVSVRANNSAWAFLRINATPFSIVKTSNNSENLAIGVICLILPDKVNIALIQGCL